MTQNVVRKIFSMKFLRNTLTFLLHYINFELFFLLPLALVLLLDPLLITFTSRPFNGWGLL